VISSYTPRDEKESEGKDSLGEGDIFFALTLVVSSVYSLGEEKRGGYDIFGSIKPTLHALLFALRRLLEELYIGVRRLSKKILECVGLGADSWLGFSFRLPRGRTQKERRERLGLICLDFDR
jgi:hypothetical protein